MASSAVSGLSKGSRPSTVRFASRCLRAYAVVVVAPMLTSICSSAGEGYKLAMTLSEATLDPMPLINLFADARLVHSIECTRSYILPRDSVEVSRVFEIMEAKKAAHGIAEWVLRSAV